MVVHTAAFMFGAVCLERKLIDVPCAKKLPVVILLFRF